MTTDQSPTSTHPSSYLSIVVDTNSLIASTTSTRHGKHVDKNSQKKSLARDCSIAFQFSQQQCTRTHYRTHLLECDSNKKKHTVCRKEGGNTHITKKTKNKIRKQVLPLYYFKSIRSFHTYHIPSPQTSNAFCKQASKQAFHSNRETFSDSIIIMYIPQQPIRSIQAQGPQSLTGPAMQLKGHPINEHDACSFSYSKNSTGCTVQHSASLHLTNQCNVRQVSCVL